MKTKTNKISVTKALSKVKNSAEKPRRLTKAAKITKLKRAAAARQNAHAKRHKATAKQHLAVTMMAILITACTGGLAFGITSNLHALPPVQVGISLPQRVQEAVAASQPATAPEPPPDQTGQASWYAIGLRDPSQLTCASTKFPRGTYLMVKNLRNGRQVICLVDDYGPAAYTQRVIDLSRGSFSIIDSLGAGTTSVEIRVVPPPAQSLNLPIPKYLGQISGYDLCRVSHHSDFCDTFRRSHL
jgi:rare lipoprotein A